MICIAYLSASRSGSDASALEAILASSRRNNAASGVTGILCHNDGSFLQILEGYAPQVHAIYETIRRDPRHSSLIEIYRGPIRERMFPDWTMALARPEQIGAEHRAFCQSLRNLEINLAPEHWKELEPFLVSFRTSIR